MKLSKKQKIITSLIGTGAILILSLGISLPLLINKSSDNSNINESTKAKTESNKARIESIKTKIQNKDFVIPKSVNTFSDSEILSAIKNQLKLKNPSLTNQDLLKIKDNIQHLKPGKKTSVILKIELENLFDTINVNVTKEKNIKLWTKSSAIVTSSNILDGGYSSFIQDSLGNIWSMGGKTVVRKGWVDTPKPTKLQVLKRDGTEWEEDIDNGLTSGSNIVDGTHGVIFEDDFGNLWSMGDGTKLQVLTKNKDGSFANSWVNDNNESGEKLLQGSLINNGQGGTIFQDFFGNLWTTSKGSRLQVLTKNKDGSFANLWDVDNSENGKLLKGSNITNGYWGTIFQDSFGNIWSMGDGTKLQVLKINSQKDNYVTTGWINDNDETSADPLLKNSNIENGLAGTIFQDKFKNLWIMSQNSKLQVLAINENGDGYVNTGWTNLNNNVLTKGSNIIDSWGGAIFQDSFGNLWTCGYSTKPQVLQANSNGDGYVNTGWSNDNTSGLLNNLKPHPAWEKLNSLWVFFQDSSNNLWAMGNEVSLQVLKANSNGDGYESSWKKAINVPGLLKDSNIINGQRGLIFEDSSKNVWSMGSKTNLQVYDKTLKKWVS